jgi:hypothetical protein
MANSIEAVLFAFGSAFLAGLFARIISKIAFFAILTHLKYPYFIWGLFAGFAICFLSAETWLKQRIFYLFKY